MIMDEISMQTTIYVCDKLTRYFKAKIDEMFQYLDFICAEKIQYFINYKRYLEGLLS